MAADSLRKLHTALVDSRNGYEEAVEDAKTPAIKSLFADMIALKEKDHRELHAGLNELGEKPDDSGSFMSAVHKTVIGVRAAVTGLEANSLSSFISGEEQIVEKYDEALKEAASNPSITATLTRQKSALLDKIALMKNVQLSNIPNS